MLTHPPTQCPLCRENLAADSLDGFCPRCLIQLAAGRGGGNLGGLLASAQSHSLFGPLEGQRFGNYELIEEIARGGMGVVFKARQLNPPRTVALKVIIGGRFANDELLERFRIEVETIARLDHPSIVPVYEASTHEGLPYFSMAYVDGSNLAAAARTEPLSPDLAVRYVMEAARAIQHAHDRGVLHRDLKPSNLLIDQAGHVWVTDFGLARWLEADSELTLTGQILGSPSYISPEQAAANRARIGPASDVYSLGAVLYYLLTGRPPFLADSAAGTVQLVLNTEAAPPRLLNPLVGSYGETICLKCLAKEPARRYHSAAELAEDCARFLAGEPIQARPVSGVEKLGLWCKRRPQLAALLVVAGTSLLAGFGLTGWQWQRAESANRRTTAALHGSQIRLADQSFREGRSVEGLSILAAVVRQNPAHPAAVNRLLDALNRSSFPAMLRNTLHQESVVWSSSLSPDEQRIATATDIKQAFVWTVADEKAPLLRLEHPDRAYLVRFSPDGRQIATACADKQLRVWDSTTGVPAFGPLPHTTEIFGLSFRPDGRAIASAEIDGTVRIWDLVDGRERFVFPAPTDPPPDAQSLAEAMRITDLTPVAFSPDGMRIMSVANARTARVWDSSTGKLKVELPHELLIVTAEFSPDGGRIATASYDGTICIWDSQSGTNSLRLKDLPTVPIQAVFTPDGTKIAAGFYDGTVRLWDIKEGKSIGQPMRHDHYVPGLAFSADGRYLLTVAFDGVARLWDPQTGAPVTGAVRAGQTLRGGRFLRDGQRFFTRGRGGLAFWGLNPPGTSSRSFGGGIPIAAIRFAWGDREILTLDEKGIGRIWDRGTLQPLTKPLTLPASLFSPLRADDSRNIKSAMAAFAWEHQTGRSLSAMLPVGEQASSFASSVDGDHVVIGLLKGDALLFDRSRREKAVLRIQHPVPFTSLAITPDGRRLLTGSADRVARVWDLASGRPISATLPHPDKLYGLECSTDGNWLVTWGAFSGALLWDLRLNPPTGRLLQHDSEVVDARFDRANARVATASLDRTVRVWDVSSARARTPALRHDNEVRRCAFTPDDRRLVTTSMDGAIRIWDSETGLPMSERLFAAKGLLSSDISPDGRWVIAGCMDGKAYLWELADAPIPAPSWLPDLAEGLAGVRLRDDLVSERLPLPASAAVWAKIQSLPDTDFYVRWVRAVFLKRQTVRPSSGP